MRDIPRHFFWFPIRLKLLFTMLLVVTIAVSVITVTMGTIFKKDKTTYVLDLTSTMALHIAEETETTLQFYQEQLRVFSRLLLAEEILEAKREEWIRQFFSDYQDFLSVSLSDQAGKERIVVYDTAKFSEVGLDKEEVEKHRRPVSIGKLKMGEILVRNSNLSPKLPSFTMTFPMIYKGESLILSAEIYLRKLLRLGHKPKGFEVFWVDREGNLLKTPHLGSGPKVENVLMIPMVGAFLEGKTLAGAMEYSLSGHPYLGAYAPVESGHLGVMVQAPQEVAYLTARELIETLVLVSLGVLVFSAVVSFILARSITRPIQKLAQVIPAVAAGNFDVYLEVKSRDEIGFLAVSMNQMADELKKREDRLKLASAALLQSEKMAAFGQLATGVAHELRNPLAGVLGYAQLALKKVGQEGPIRAQLSIIEGGVKRCLSIIERLMKFARQEKVDFSAIDLNLLVEETITLVAHLMVSNGVVIEKALSSPLPKMNGNANQIMQVVMNLMMNAQQAMPEGGVIKVATLFKEDHIEFLVADSGTGIPKDLHQKIFEPFFTTKQAGKGTGMGLSVSYGIVQEHQGKIHVESEVGQGTTFTVTFPILGVGIPEISQAFAGDTEALEHKTNA